MKNVTYGVNTCAVAWSVSLNKTNQIWSTKLLMGRQQIVHLCLSLWTFTGPTSCAQNDEYRCLSKTRPKLIDRMPVFPSPSNHRLTTKLSVQMFRVIYLLTINDYLQFPSHFCSFKQVDLYLFALVIVFRSRWDLHFRQFNYHACQTGWLNSQDKES